VRPDAVGGQLASELAVEREPKLDDDRQVPADGAANGDPLRGRRRGGGVIALLLGHARIVPRRAAARR
jgi:hypothetical protein